MYPKSEGGLYVPGPGVLNLEGNAAAPMLNIPNVFKPGRWISVVPMFLVLTVWKAVHV